MPVCPINNIVLLHRAPRSINISSLVLRRENNGDPQVVDFIVHCSKGTYVRSLAYDIGRSLGTVAHLSSLRRESIGDHVIGSAWSFQDLLEKLRSNCAQSSFCTEKQWKKKPCSGCPNQMS
jgi:tRNA U55 pseudouridine synthase TruB